MIMKMLADSDKDKGVGWLTHLGKLYARAPQVKAIFGLQNIPWICKTTVYGSEARILGPKEALKAASSPVEHTAFVCGIVEQMFDITTGPLPNFLCLTLTPSNQIIHPARCVRVSDGVAWASPCSSATVTVTRRWKAAIPLAALLLGPRGMLTIVRTLP